MRAAIALGLLLAFAAPAASLGLLAATDEAPLHVLVGFSSGADRTAVALRIEEAGGRIVRTSVPLGFAQVATRDPAALATALAADADVAYVEPDAPTSALGAEWNGAQWNGAQWNGAEWNGMDSLGPGAGDPGAPRQWGLDATRAPAAWQTEPGRGAATLCVLDTGVDSSHPDLAPHVRAGWSALDGTSDTRDPAGHGTHVASIAAARHGDGYGVAGVANSLILPVKVLRADGTGTAADLALGLAWCADRGADVALLALGVTGRPQTVDRALAYADARGVVLVASAGNRGCDGCVGYPASDPRVLAVAALAPDGSVAPFSSRGPEVDVAAPGVEILGAVPGAFAYGSGTSQAVAWAAGAAALVRERDASLPPAAVRARLTENARDVGPAGFDARSGHGALDVAAAIEG